MIGRDRIWVVMLRQPRPDDFRPEVDIQSEVERAEADGYEFCTATNTAIIMVKQVEIDQRRTAGSTAAEG